MSDSLSTLRGVFTEYNAGKIEQEHESASKTVQDTLEELREQLGDSPQMGEKERQQVQEAYSEVVKPDVQNLQNHDFDLNEFPEEVNDLSEDLQEILRSPRAEAIVEDIYNWLLSTGLSPLTDEQQQELKEIIKIDIEVAKQAVQDCKTSHDSLRGYLGSAQSKIDGIVFETVTNVGSVNDLEQLAGALDRLENAWIGDWSMDYSTEAGEKLYQDLIDELEETLTGVVESRDTITGISHKVEQEANGAERRLQDISDVWKEIEDRVSRIDAPDSEFSTAVVYDWVENKTGPVQSLNKYQTILNNAKDQLSELETAARVDIERYQTDSADIPEPIRAEVEQLIETAEETATLISEIFAAEELDSIESIGEQITDQGERLEREFAELKSQIQSEVQTTRELTTKFDLNELQGELNDLLSQVRGTNDVAKLVDSFEKYQSLNEQVREPIREQMTSEQESLFTYMVEYDDKKTDKSLWLEVTSKLDRDQKEIVADLAALEELGLIALDIEIK